LVEHRSPKPAVGGSSPSCPAPGQPKRGGVLGPLAVRDKEKIKYKNSKKEQRKKIKKEKKM
jgi:hypothetical protein